MSTSTQDPLRRRSLQFSLRAILVLVTFVSAALTAYRFLGTRSWFSHILIAFVIGLLAAVSSRAWYRIRMRQMPPHCLAYGHVLSSLNSMWKWILWKGLFLAMFTLDFACITRLAFLDEEFQRAGGYYFVGFGFAPLGLLGLFVLTCDSLLIVDNRESRIQKSTTIFAFIRIVEEWPFSAFTNVQLTLELKPDGENDDHISYAVRLRRNKNVADFDISTYLNCAVYTRAKQSAQSIADYINCGLLEFVPLLIQQDEARTIIKRSGNKVFFISEEEIRTEITEPGLEVQSVRTTHRAVVCNRCHAVVSLNSDRTCPVCQTKAF